MDNEKMPVLSVSASKNSAGAVHVSFCNLDPKNAAAVECELRGFKAGCVGGSILTAADMRAHNTFEDPTAIAPADFDGARVKGNVIVVTFPSKSVVVLEIR